MSTQPRTLPAPLDRRTLLALVAGAVFPACRAATSPSVRASDLRASLAALERGGRLGVAVLDTAKGTLVGHRLDERFALCSSFKLVLAAMTLERASNGGRATSETVMLRASDLVGHSPVTGGLVAEAAARGEDHALVSLGMLAHAAQTTSDNGAANLLLADHGGPPAFTAFCRVHCDDSTRVDRYEPAMNDVREGDPRDTTTPRAMAQLVARLLGPHGLAAADRATLRSWLIATETGAARVRAGLPADWVAGDKTGTGGSSVSTVKVNDVVWLEPPGRAPLVVAAYYDTGEYGEWPTEAQEAVLSEVGRVVAALG